MTSAMKETMLAVSRTVSPCAIWLFFSSRSCGVSPSRLQADANENLVLVELSRKIEIPRPESKILVEMLFSLRCLSASATVNTAASSSSVLSQVQKKLSLYIFLKSSVSSFPINCFSSASMAMISSRLLKGRLPGEYPAAVQLFHYRMYYRMLLFVFPPLYSSISEVFSSVGYSGIAAAYSAAALTRSSFQVISFGACAWLSAPGPKPTHGMP